MRFTLLLLLASLTATAQSPWRVQLLDSAGFTPTAMGSVENLVAVASQPEVSTFFPRTGDLRLRIHPVTNQTGELLVPIANLQFPGKFVANDLVGMPNLAVSRFLIAGGFHDTCYLPNDTLIGFEPLALDPFLMRVNAYSGQPEWVWHRRQAQNNYIHKINYEAGQGTILASGLYDDVSGWLAAFNASNGQLLWEKAWPGARTVSDARFDPNFAGAVLFTGTIDDFGHLNNIPTPLSPLPNTGYRTFLARYWPANDSVQFIATTPYITFDFEPTILPLRLNSTENVSIWITPTIQNNKTERLARIYSPPSGFFDNYYEYQQWFGQFIGDVFNYGPVFCYQGATAAPNQMQLQLFVSSYSDRLTLAPGSEVGRAGLLRRYSTSYITVKATGPLFVDASRDTILQVPGATPFTPRWAVIYSLLDVVDVAESKKLSFKVYPNPVTSQEIFVEMDKTNGAEVHWIFRDLQGRRLAAGTLDTDENRIQLPALSAGMYLLEVQQGEKQGWSRVVLP